MSWQTTTAVTAGSRHKGSNLLTLLMLANYSDPAGGNIFPSIARLAKDCRMSERGVQYCIKKLKDSGELKEDGTGVNGVKRYRIDHAKLREGAKIAGCKETPEGVQNPVSGGEAAFTLSISEHPNKNHGFEAFWKAYPKKNAKGDAEKAWKNIPAADYPAIMASVELQKKNPDWIKARGQFIPYPASWLRGKCWLDASPPIMSERNSAATGSSVFWHPIIERIVRDWQDGYAYDRVFVGRQFRKALEHATRAQISSYTEKLFAPDNPPAEWALLLVQVDDAVQTPGEGKAAA